MIINSIISGNGGLTASIFVTGLSETDTVTATKDGKSYSGKWVSKPNTACVVPDGYTQLEYIESTGTQCINTGVPAVKPLRFIGKAHNVETGSKSGFLFCGMQNSTYYGANVYFNGSSDKTTSYGGTTNNGTNTVIHSSMMKEISEFDFNFSGSSINTTINDITQQASISISDNENCEIYLLRQGTNTTSFYVKVRLYNLAILNGDSYVRNFVPCKRSSDNTIGLYDLVTNTFFVNSGTGTFVAGAEVQQTIDGFVIDNIKSYGTYTITATDGTNTATKDVLVDMAIQFDIQMTI